LLQAETKKDYDSWLSALKQTAYSRVGGGELFNARMNSMRKSTILTFFYQKMKRIRLYWTVLHANEYKRMIDSLNVKLPSV